MRLTIQHETRYSYAAPPKSVIEVLRLTPCSTATQTVRSWRIDVTGDVTLRRADDAFGNVTHTFSLSDPGEALTVTATGTVETDLTNGVVFGTRERLPLGVFLRPTGLTEPDDAIRQLGADAREASDGSLLDRSHKMNLAVHHALRWEQGTTDVRTPAAAALAAGRGVCQDLTHVLVAAARAEGLPARYVSGYRYMRDRARDAHEPHAWAEIFVEPIGWITFDPTVGASCTNAYVRLAVGLDFAGASPIRGAVYGGSGETMTVTVAIDHTGWQQTEPGDEGQGQSQSQSQGSQSQSQGGQSRSQGGQSQGQGQGKGQSQSQGLRGQTR